jgi:hypothetical protein
MAYLNHRGEKKSRETKGDQGRPRETKEGKEVVVLAVNTNNRARKTKEEAIEVHWKRFKLLLTLETISSIGFA